MGDLGISYQQLMLWAMIFFDLKRKKNVMPKYRKFKKGKQTLRRNGKQNAYSPFCVISLLSNLHTGCLKQGLFY